MRQQVRQATLKCVIKLFVMICDKISTIRSQFNDIWELWTVQLNKTLTRMTLRYSDPFRSKGEVG